MLLKTQNTNNRTNKTTRSAAGNGNYKLVTHRGKNARKGSQGGLYLLISKGWTLTAESRAALSDLQWEDRNGRRQWLNVRFAPGLTYQDKEYAWWGSLGPASVLDEEAREQILKLVKIEPIAGGSGKNRPTTEKAGQSRASITINGITYYAETPAQTKQKPAQKPARSAESAETDNNTDKLAEKIAQNLIKMFNI